MKNINIKKGFTLIELLVAVGIIAVLASIVLAMLSDGRRKGVDGAIKQNLGNSRSQAEVFYNTAGVNSYNNVCGVAGVGGIGPFIFAASKAVGLAGAYTVDSAGLSGRATCNQSANSWAAEVPLSTAGKFWCVDNTGVSKEESGTSFSAADDYSCL